MGIFDFLRKLTKEKEEEVPKVEKISFSSLGEWNENRIKELKTKEKESLGIVQKMIDSLASELKEKIKAAEDFDIKSKKEEDRIKSAVEDGRKKYIESVEDLMENMNSIKKESLEKVVVDSDRIFSDFNKKSRMSYERATILIGKEMAEIRESLKNFSRELRSIFNENKDISESLSTASFIKQKLANFEKSEKEIQEINMEITSLAERADEKETRNRELIVEIEKIKKGKEYLERQRRQENIKNLKSDLEKDIFDLGQLIDFKALGNFYHIFENEMQVVKAHKDNFKGNFEKDWGKEILSLLDTSKLNNKKISEKTSQINKKKEEILELEKDLEEEKNRDKTSQLDLESKKTVVEIGELKNKKEREERRLEKIREEKRRIVSELKERLEKFGVKLD